MFLFAVVSCIVSVVGSVVVCAVVGGVVGGGDFVVVFAVVGCWCCCGSIKCVSA